MNIGICVIAYNRLNSLKRVLRSLSEAYYDNNNIPLIISIDKSDNNDVSEFADSFEWQYGSKNVIKHSVNLGLRNHVLLCGELLEYYDALVVLEDDITVAPSFYFYARQCVDEFHDNPLIAGISLYSFPFNYHNYLPFYPLYSDSDVFLIQNAQSWGEVWMKDSWRAFKKWYDNNNEEFAELPHLPKSICDWPKSSWLKYHTKYCIEQNKYFIYPYVSLSTNNSDIGVHCASNNTVLQSKMLYGKKEYFYLNPIIRYDSFFENEAIYDSLGIAKDELCVDIYGCKANRENKRYWLTTSCEPYKVICKFGLSQKPYEWNIINKVPGSVIFLYDTNEKGVKPKRTIQNRIDLLKYWYGFLNLKDIVKKIKRFFVDNV